MQADLPGDAHVVAICSGANMTFERLQQIAERTLIGSGREVLVAVAMPERAGALLRFCTEVVGDHSITEFKYRLNDRRKAHVLLGISVASPEDKAAFMRKMDTLGYERTDLSDDDIAKEHVRHMIGGTSPNVADEHFYQINFPERPSALGEFLATLGTRWNISAFHYRSQASDAGNVLIGFENGDRAALEARLSETGYEWSSIDEAASIRLFVGPSAR